MAQFDEEYWANIISGYYVSDLNTCITAINTDKNDGLSMLAVANDAFLYGLQHSVPCFNPFVVFTSEVLEGGDDLSVVNARLNVSLVHSIQTMTGPDAFKLMYRYKKALRDVILGRYNSLTGIRYTIMNNQLVEFQTETGIMQSVSIGIDYSIGY